ncbi:hypothetical protein D3C76_895760 [compost metagenome]
MRSISSTGRSWNAVLPAVTEPTLTPSIITSTWSDSVPRMNSAVVLPGPPLFARDTPGSLRSSSGTDLAWLRSISARSSTLTEARLCETLCSVRVAVTSWSSRASGSAPAIGDMQETPHSAKAAGHCRELLIRTLSAALTRAAQTRGGMRRTGGAGHRQGKNPTIRRRPPRCHAMRQAGLRACE